MRARQGLVSFSLLVAITGSPVSGQEVALKPGLVLKGRTSKSKALSSDAAQRGSGDNGQYRFIDLRYKYYFVPHKLVASVAADGFKGESFKIRHKTVGRKRMPDYIGGFSNVTPFDTHGVRTVTLSTPNGPKKVLQAISQLTPTYAWLRSLDHNWQSGMPTTSLEKDVLDKVLQKAIDVTDPHDRLAGCRYLIEAGQLELAGIWIQRVETEFPAYKKQCKAATLRLRQRFAEQVLTELIQRKLAGQHRLVQASLAKFPKNDLSTAVLNSVEQLRKEYSAKETAIATIKDHLKKLEAAIDPEVAQELAPLRAEVSQNLGFSSLERLQAYINLSKDKTLKPDERLSIAYSGWLLGSADAITNIQETLGLWAARDHVASYLNTNDPLAKRRALDELNRLEGVSPRPLARLLANSPPLRSTEHQRGQFTEIMVPTPDGPATYKVILPPEYSPYHDYPVVVTLRQANRRTDDALIWWAGTPAQPLQAQRRGYIVIAPEYLPPGARTYESNPRAHEIVLACLRDGFGRFSIDSDRVFLSGHGAGGDAAFDIGMSHPDLFAGVIPICGFVGPECTKLTTNGADVPWYVVSGQRHRDALAHNSFVLHQIATTKRNEDVIVCEYRDRGFEDYYDEVQDLFRWMEFYARDTMPRRFEAATVRPESNQFYWIEASGFPDLITDQDFSREPNKKRKPLKSLEFSLNVTAKNTIQINNRGGASEITLRLTDSVIDFSKTVRLDGRGVPRGKKIDPRPNVEDVLTDFQLHRDRKRIALQRVAL